MKILVVEDSRSSLAALTQYVWHVGATALEAFHRERPDLILAADKALYQTKHDGRDRACRSDVA